MDWVVSVSKGPPFAGFGLKWLKHARGMKVDQRSRRYAKRRRGRNECASKLVVYCKKKRTKDIDDDDDDDEQQR